MSESESVINCVICLDKKNKCLFTFINMVDDTDCHVYESILIFGICTKCFDNVCYCCGNLILL